MGGAIRGHCVRPRFVAEKLPRCHFQVRSKSAPLVSNRRESMGNVRIEPHARHVEEPAAVELSPVNHTLTPFKCDGEGLGRITGNEELACQTVARPGRDDAEPGLTED